MRKLNYLVALSETEYNRLKTLVSSGKHNAKQILHANILLAADTKHHDYHERKKIAEMYHCHFQTVQTVCTNYAKYGLDRAVFRKKRTTSPVPKKVTGKIEAEIIALSCSEPPEGYSRWTLRLLAEKSVELSIIDAISHSRVGEILKK